MSAQNTADLLKGLQIGGTVRVGGGAGNNNNNNNQGNGGAAAADGGSNAATNGRGRGRGRGGSPRHDGNGGASAAGGGPRAGYQSATAPVAAGAAVPPPQAAAAPVSAWAKAPAAGPPPAAFGGLVIGGANGVQVVQGPGPQAAAGGVPPPPPPGGAPAPGPAGGIRVPLAIPGAQPFMAFPGTVLGTAPPGGARPANPQFPAHLQVGGVKVAAPPPPPPGYFKGPAPGAPGGRGRGGGPRQPKRSPFEENEDSGEDTPSPTAAAGDGNGNSAAHIAPPLPPPSKPEVDPQLVAQLLRRYEDQEANSDKGMLKPPGLLDADEALRVIDAHDVTFIVTDTGTGKSTILPKLLMEKGMKVVSSQPRRTATINLAMRVASLRNEPLGANVGYLVRGDHIGDADTRLMYMTSYTLFLYIVSHPNDLGYTHFIIDEFHERQPDVEVMLALLKLARKVTNQKFKIVLMSASAEVHDWKPYFDGLSIGIYSTCAPRYPVYEYYQEEVCRLVGAAFNPGEVTPVVSSLSLKNNLFLVERLLEFLAKHAEPQHSILVFLPGRTVVEQMAKFVQTKLGSQMEAVPWYRDVELERIDAAIKRRNDTRKKVYLATDIAEVSITLPDVVFVIDSGTTKKPRIDTSVRNSVVFPPLELLWTSKSAVSQRKGRIGRVQQGFYLGLLPETHLPLLVDMEPQIANSRIDELSLHILQIAANPLAVFNLCRQNTKRECVQLSTNILVDNGCALPQNHPHASDEAVEHPDCAPWRDPVMNHPANAELHGAAFITTVKGKIAQRLPLSISCSLIVTQGLLLNVDSVGIVTAAIVASGTPFYAYSGDDRNPEAKRKQVDEVSDAMAEYAKAAPSDILAAVIATLEYKCMSAHGLSEADEERWCSERALSLIRLQNIVKLEAQIKEQLGAVVSFVDIQDPDELLRVVRKAPTIVSWLAASAFLERAIYVEYDVAEAQRRRKAGRSLFLGFDALCDYQVPSCVSWKPGNVIIPTILQARYDKLFGTFALRFTPAEFNVMLLLLNYAVYYDDKVRQDGPPPGMQFPPGMMPPPPSPPYMIFGVELHQRKLMFRVVPEFASMLLQFREGLGTRARMQRVMVQQNITMADEEALMKAFVENGLPRMTPQALGERLAGMLLDLIDKVQQRGSPAQPHHSDFMPTRVSMLLSSKPSVHPFVPVAPMEENLLPPPTDAPSQQQQFPERGRGGGRGGRGAGGRGRGGQQQQFGGQQPSSPPVASPVVGTPTVDPMAAGPQ